MEELDVEMDDGLSDIDFDTVESESNSPCCSWAVLHKHPRPEVLIAQYAAIIPSLTTNPDQVSTFLTRTFRHGWTILQYLEFFKHMIGKLYKENDERSYRRRLMLKIGNRGPSTHQSSPLRQVTSIDEMSDGNNVDDGWSSFGAGAPPSSIFAAFYQAPAKPVNW